MERGRPPKGVEILPQDTAKARDQAGAAVGVSGRYVSEAQARPSLSLTATRNGPAFCTQGEGLCAEGAGGLRWIPCGSPRTLDRSPFGKIQPNHLFSKRPGQESNL